jgi:malate synthase
MIGRRRLLGAGMMAGVLGTVPAGDAEAGGLQRPARDDEELERVRRAVEEVRDAIRQERQFVELSAVRNAQQTFLRTNGKLPDFLEVGMDIWFGLHDWHVRWQQPLAIGRDIAGRYTIKVMDTTIILRPEAAGNFVGIPYDNR